MFLQTMCEAKLEWDQLLPTELLSTWQKLNAGLLEAQTISIPRCCTKQADGEVISYTLCGFCDASLGSVCSCGLPTHGNREGTRSEVPRCQDKSIFPQKTDHSMTGTFVCITPVLVDDEHFSEFGERIAIVAPMLLHRLQGRTFLDTRHQ